MAYAIISLGGKQHRVEEGQRLLVDNLPHDEGKTFHPDVLFVGGDGTAEFAPKGVQVTAKVMGSALGEKIRIGKYKRRTGYRRHTGHRAKLTQIEITAIGAKAAPPRAAEPKAEATAKPTTRARPRATKATAAKPKAGTAAAKPKAPAKPRTRTPAKTKDEAE
jgi:large subunit ribosomal protein L21